MRDRFNYGVIEGEVSAQYNDMKGLVALDGHGIGSLVEPTESIWMITICLASAFMMEG